MYQTWQQPATITSYHGHRSQGPLTPQRQKSVSQRWNKETLQTGLSGWCSKNTSGGIDK